MAHHRNLTPYPAFIEALLRLESVEPKPGWHNGTTIAEAVIDGIKVAETVISATLWRHSFAPVITGIGALDTRDNAHNVGMMARTKMLTDLRRRHPAFFCRFTAQLLENQQDVMADHAMAAEAIEAAIATWDAEKPPTQAQIIQGAQSYLDHCAHSQRGLPGRAAVLTCELKQTPNGGFLLFVAEPCWCRARHNTR